jgi:hypothetical protein
MGCTRSRERIASFGAAMPLLQGGQSCPSAAIMLHMKANTMRNVIKHPGAPVPARKTKRSAKAARGNAKRSVLPNSPEWMDEIETAEARIIHAATDGALEVYRKACDAGIESGDALSCSRAVLAVVGLAAEAAAARAAGYDSWAAFEAAKAARLIGYVV